MPYNLVKQTKALEVTASVTGGGPSMDGVTAAIQDVSNEIARIAIPDTATAINSVATAISDKEIPTADVSGISTAIGSSNTHLSSMKSSLSSMKTSLSTIMTSQGSLATNTGGIKTNTGTIATNIESINGTLETQGAYIAESINNVAAALTSNLEWKLFGTSTTSFDISSVVGQAKEFLLVYMLTTSANLEVTIQIPAAELGQTFANGYYYDANYNASVSCTTSRSSISNNTTWTHIKYGSSVTTLTTMRLYWR